MRLVNRHIPILKQNSLRLLVLGCILTVHLQEHMDIGHIAIGNMTLGHSATTQYMSNAQ